MNLPSFLNSLAIAALALLFWQAKARIAVLEQRLEARPAGLVWP